MGYYLKHSAKGTTWGDHKYIRKEGNRYIYPEDVKKVASNNTFTLGKDGQTVRLDSNGNPTNKGRVNNNSSYNSSSSSKNPYDDLSGKELVDQLRKDVESGKISNEYAEAYLSNTFGEYQPISGESLSSSKSSDPYDGLSDSDLKLQLRKDVNSGKLPKEYASELYWNKTGDGLYDEADRNIRNAITKDKLSEVKILSEAKKKVDNHRAYEKAKKEFEREQAEKINQTSRDRVPTSADIKDTKAVEARVNKLETDLVKTLSNKKFKELYDIDKELTYKLNKKLENVEPGTDEYDKLVREYYAAVEKEAHKIGLDYDKFEKEAMKKRQEFDSLRPKDSSNTTPKLMKAMDRLPIDTKNRQNKNRNYMPSSDKAKRKEVISRESEANRKAKMPTNAYAGYIKRKDDPANRYRLVPNKNEQHKNVVKKRSYKYSDYGVDQRDEAEINRAIGIAKRRGIKDKDKIASRSTAKYMKRTRHRYK